MSYRLYDVASRHKQDPSGFSIPRAVIRNRMQSGEIVSIGLVSEHGDPENPEWLWTRIEIAREGGRYIGVLLDSAKSVPILETGNRIEFTADNIWEIYIEEGDARWIDGSKLAMVSGYVESNGAWPARLLRIPPMAPEYSGWFIFSGEEPPDYIKDFSNFISIPIYDLINRFPNLQSVLAAPIATEWKWDHDAAEYNN